MRRRLFSASTFLVIALGMFNCLSAVAQTTASSAPSRNHATIMLSSSARPSTAVPFGSGRQSSSASYSSTPTRVTTGLATSNTPGMPPQSSPPIPPSSERQNTATNRSDTGKPLPQTHVNFTGGANSASFAPQTVHQTPNAQSVKKMPPLREWIVISHSLEEAEIQRRELSKLKLKIIRRTQLENLGRFISVFRLPDTINIDEITKILKRDFPDWRQEANQRFFPLTAKKQNTDPVKNWGQNAIQFKPELNDTCSSHLVIAMLDSGVNTQLTEFSGAEIYFKNMNDEIAKSNSFGEGFRHGTSVAALLVGREQVNGMLPNAKLHAINIFAYDTDGGLHTRSDWIMSALNDIAGIRPEVQIVNLSFGGNYSAEMESVFQLLHKRMLFVAAAGNSGENAIQYPAAYENVMAVGAINHEQKKSALSNYGEQLRWVAPGEDIWTVNESGEGYFASGTSFAAPFVTAIYALTTVAKNTELFAVKDLGAKGRDKYYGAGLPQLSITGERCR